ncbi:MAG TPA: tetratricopeptide repeat protein [Anaeromyxobacteraceae bacterium]
MSVSRTIPAMFLVLLAACGGQPDAMPRLSAGAPLASALAAPAAPATRELRAGRLTEARAMLEGALAKDPDGLGALNDLAVTYAAEERFDAARQLFEEALARGGPQEQQVALVNLGELYALEGYLSAASAHLASARAIDPARPEPSYALALLADVRGDRAGAAAALATALAADPGGAARKDLVFLYPEERIHLEALLAEASGDAALATTRFRELARGHFPALAQTAQRHLEEP